MNMNKSIFGMMLLIMVGLLLAACASATESEPADQKPQVSPTEKSVYVGPILVD